MVVDASVALGWVFVDQKSGYTDKVLERVGHEGMLVPSLFHLEVGNILNLAVRRGRIPEARVAAFLGRLSRLRIQVDPFTADYALSTTLLLARQHELAVYDAAYLELALREGLPLATQDQALAAVATQLGCRFNP